MHDSTHQNPERKRGEAAVAVVARAYWPVHVRLYSPNLAATVIVTLLTLLLPACGVSTTPLVLQLRDAQTKSPIEGAGIEADSLALGPSLSPGDIIDELRGRRAAHTSQGTTNSAGAVRLEVVPGRALRLMVLRPGGSPAFILFDDGRSDAWSLLSQTPGSPQSMEVRTLPPEFPTD